MLIDQFDRSFKYLRLSVTEVCNFKCTYCLPNGYQPSLGREPELALPEIKRLTKAFSKLGVSKIRLTGGEPTIRKDIVQIVDAISHQDGIKQIALTTNGYRLAKIGKDLKSAGLNSINISLDSLDPETFKNFTGMDRFKEVMDGIDLSISLGFENVKVNSVLFKKTSMSQLEQFMNWVKDKPISVRFIELMRTGHNAELFREHYVSAGEIQFELLKQGWLPVQREQNDGPALVYRHPAFMGSIGVIAPYSKEFCKTCNRLRVTAQGALRLCLFAEAEDLSLRGYLQSDNDADHLVELVCEKLNAKPLSHRLQEGIYGNTWNLASIGG